MKRSLLILFISVFSVIFLFYSLIQVGITLVYAEVPSIEEVQSISK